MTLTLEPNNLSMYYIIESVIPKEHANKVWIIYLQLLQNVEEINRHAWVASLAVTPSFASLSALEKIRRHR